VVQVDCHYGSSFAKTTNLDIIKQMIVAVCEEEKYLQSTMSAQQAADMFPLALTDNARKSSMLQVYPCFVHLCALKIMTHGTAQQNGLQIITEL
jgi:hypothetical protein